MAYGDHIYVERLGVYTHDGVDVGDGFVIHRGSIDGTKSGALISKTTIAEFSDGATVQIKLYGTRLSPDEAVARAESMLGEPGYHVLWHNCEHFATWCVTGEYVSDQVDTAVSTTRVVGLGIGVPAVSVRTVTALGYGSSSSGPNLMSGLARLGGTVTSGLLVAGVAAGAATTYGMCQLMPDKPSLTGDERCARRNGRYGTAAGAVAGVALSFHLVGTLGVAGYSGAGLTSGLSILGGKVGGGMAAGTKLAIALPAVAAILLGYLIYRLTQWWLQRRAAATVKPDTREDYGSLAPA
jgi:Lecithin retinol acyltransferase